MPSTRPTGDVAVIVGDRAGDLSGSLIEASGPVAVFVGHDCTQMPIGRQACDHLEEQLFPLEVLGREYVVSRLRDRAAVVHVTRIVAPLNNTVVRAPPSPPPGLASRPPRSCSPRPSSFRCPRARGKTRRASARASA